jgi:hypothetical protein
MFHIVSQVFSGALERECKIRNRKQYRRKYFVLTKNSLEFADYDDMNASSHIKLRNMVNLSLSSILLLKCFYLI